MTDIKRSDIYFYAQIIFFVIPPSITKFCIRKSAISAYLCTFKTTRQWINDTCWA